MESKYLNIRSAKDASMLTGLAFEDYLSQLFECLGYKSTKTKASGDFGGDLLFTKDDKRIVVQAKQYKKSVGFDAIKEAHFAKAFYAASESWVITTSDFTPQAIEAAAIVGVVLIPGKDLDNLINQALSKSSQAVGTTTGRSKAAGGRRKSDFTIIASRKGAKPNKLKQYHGSGPFVIIPEGVTILGKGAVSDRRFESLRPPYCVPNAIRSVTLPNGLKVIGEDCFRGCHNLSTINTPSTLTTIRDGAFESCSFASVHLRSNISYGKSVYRYNHWLRDLIVDEGVSLIPDSCFEGCGKLIDVPLPNSVHTIGNYTFQNCSSLESIVIPEGVETIGLGAFNGCKSLEEVYLPQSLKRLAIDAFDGCPILGGGLVCDAFDLQGVTLYTPYKDHSFRTLALPITETDARSDSRINSWKTRYCKEHGVLEIEGLEIESARVQGRVKSKQDEWAQTPQAKSIFRQLRELGLSKDLHMRFVFRRNFFTKIEDKGAVDLSTL